MPMKKVFMIALTNVISGILVSLAASAKDMNHLP